MERYRQGTLLQVGQAVFPQPEANQGALAEPPGPLGLQAGMDCRGGSPDRCRCSRNRQEVGADRKDGRRTQDITHDQEPLLHSPQKLNKGQPNYMRQK